MQAGALKACCEYLVHDKRVPCTGQAGVKGRGEDVTSGVGLATPVEVLEERRDVLRICSVCMPQPPASSVEVRHGPVHFRPLIVCLA